MAKATIPQLFSQLLQDGVAVARAEVALVRSKLMLRVAAVRTAAVFFAAAAVVALLALIGLVMGFVLSLAQLMDPALAGLVVLVAGCAIAGVLAWIGVGHLSAKPEAVVAETEAAIAPPLVEPDRA